MKSLTGLSSTSARKARRSHREGESDRRGFALLYFLLLLIALLGMTALAVDYGKGQLARTQLQIAADAAARAAVWTVRSNPAASVNTAVTLAAANTCVGSSVVLSPSADVVLGKWDPVAKTFTPLSGPSLPQANSVQVTARRTAARGNAVPTVFGPAINVNSVDVQTTATAEITGGQPMAGGIIALNGISMKGIPTIDSYNSALGPYNVTKGQNAEVASNSNITGNGNPTIDGQAFPGPGDTVDSSIDVTGGWTPLDQPLVEPPVDASPYKTKNDNAKLGSAIDAQGNISLKGNGSLHVPAGTYYVNNLSMVGNATLIIDGPATFYVTGSVSLAGTVDTVANVPANFKIDVAGSGTVDLKGNSALYSAIYAPQSAISLNGTTDFYGAMTGLSLSMVGNSAIHNDTSLVQLSPVQVRLVK